MTAPAAMPGEEDVARALWDSFHKAGRRTPPPFPGDVLGPARYSDAHFERDRLLAQARAVLDLFAPILAEKERAEREWAFEKERADMAVAQMVKQNGRMRELVALLDQQMGTPCEQIRHRQEVEALEARALAAEAALAAERERCAEIAEAWRGAAVMTPAGAMFGANTPNAIAAAIRAQGE